MYISMKKLTVLGAILGLIVLLAGIIHMHNLAVYTASLATRPFYAGLVGTIKSLEPARLSNHQERLIASAMYEGLVYYDEKTKSIKPALAKKWKYSRDAKSLTIELKNDINFSNGKNLTAQDVKAAWERNLSSASEWSSLGLYLSISGSKDRLAGKNQDIHGIQATGKYTIKVSFDKPNAAFIYILGNPAFWIYDCAAQIDPLPGTGPFILKDNKDNKNLLFVRNDKYYRGLPRLAAINFSVFDDELTALAEYKAGKLDYLDSVPLSEVKKIKADPQYQEYYMERPLLETYSLAFNMNREPYAGNYLLRRAMNYAIDRKAIIDEVFGGSYLEAKGVTPSGIEGYNEEMVGYSYKPQKAQELLAEAGYSGDKRLPILMLTYNSGEGHRLVAEAVATQLGKLGIEVQTQAQEWNYHKKQMQQLAMSFFRLGWQADYYDADSFVYSLFHSSQRGTGNYTGYSNPQVDKLLDQSRTKLDREERLKLLKQAEEIIVDDAPCLWLFQKQAAKLIGKDVDSLEVDGLEMIDWYRVELFKPSLDTENKPQHQTITR